MQNTYSVFKMQICLLVIWLIVLIFTVVVSVFFNIFLKFIYSTVKFQVLELNICLYQCNLISHGSSLRYMKYSSLHPIIVSRTYAIRCQNSGQIIYIFNHKITVIY